MSEKAVAGYMKHSERHEARGNGFKFEPTKGENVAHCVSTRAGSRPTDNFIKVAGRLTTINGHDILKRVYDTSDISPTLDTFSGGNREPKIVASRGRNPENPSDRTKGAPTEQRLEARKDGLTNTITTVQKDNYVAEPVTTRGKDIVGTIRSSIHKPGERNIVKNITDGLGYEGVIEPGLRIRKLTERECWRLMGRSDEDFDKAASVCSRTQLYRQAGNSIVTTVLEAIFKNLLHLDD